jgi:hypothetical protein
MIAFGIGQFIDTTAITISPSILSNNELSVVSGIVVDGSSRVSGDRPDTGCLIELDFELWRIHGWVESHNSPNKQQANNNSVHKLIKINSITKIYSIIIQII